MLTCGTCCDSLFMSTHWVVFTIINTLIIQSSSLRKLFVFHVLVLVEHVRRL
jgi:Fe-S-cluster containining protein